MSEQDARGGLNGRIRLTLLVLALMGAAFFGSRIMPDAVAAVNGGAEKELPVYCVDTEEEKVSLTFDAAWGNEDVSKILYILGKHKVRASFFMTGGWIEKFPEEVKAIAEAGHDLGSHSENHLHMSRLDAEKCREELMKPHEKVKELAGREMKLFRAPYGDYNNTVLDAAKDCGYFVIQWDVDGLDTKRRC